MASSARNKFYINREENEGWRINTFSENDVYVYSCSYMNEEEDSLSRFIYELSTGLLEEVDEKEYKKFLLEKYAEALENLV
jgi:hypothetical protein